MEEHTESRLTSSTKTIDAICLGRAAVDLYGEQIGETLEGMRSFRKYVGGSSANMAVGMARLGLKAAMLTRVGDEPLGEFVRSEMAANGVDVSHVIADPDRLTGLAILAVRDRETFPLVFYRENCADMAISEEDFDEFFLASAKALVITGTHFSTAATDSACRKAVEYARRNGTRTVLDIDYRPVLWGLTGHGLGEVRFVGSDRVTEHIQGVMPLFDLVVGTEEEFHIAGGSTHTITALRRLRAKSAAVLVVKRGTRGASVFPEGIPDSLDSGIAVPGFPVDVLNVLGAGDAFMSGFMSGWIAGEDYSQCCRYGNACGALVVSRHGCAPAMPGRDELRVFLERGGKLRRPDDDLAFLRLHRASTRDTRRNEIYALAFDHRTHLEELADSVGANRDLIAPLKGLIFRGLLLAGERSDLNGCAGMLVDKRFGEEVLLKQNGSDLWVARPVELTGSRPLRFECGKAIALELAGWPSNHVAKCLVRYHPDDPPELKREQERSLLALYEACLATDRELLLEVLLPGNAQNHECTTAEALDCLYEAGIHADWWKLAPGSARSWELVSTTIAAQDPNCRGVLLLGQKLPVAELGASFDIAARQPLCRGFAVGRTIITGPSHAWLSGQSNDESTIEAVADGYLLVVDAWRRSRAHARTAGEHV